MLSLLGTLIIGLVVGAIAKLIVPGKEPGGCLVTIAIGVAGSFVAFYLGRLLGWTSGHPDSLRPVGFIPSLLGPLSCCLFTIGYAGEPDADVPSLRYGSMLTKGK
jgi:uncharacterized membrane protein YeaQ/YmgE (transglycosylase-associated protein family)